MKIRTLLAVMLVAASSLASLPSHAAGYKLQLVATDLAQPVHVTHAGDGSGRLFIVERAGVVKILKDGAVLPEPFIDISLLVGDYFLEQGLLSIAFHPDYESNGEAFLSYTDVAGQNVIARYRVGADPNKLDPASGQILFTQFQPFLNHNGGLILFGPDGYLYMGIGDGGAANDPWFSGQNPQTLLGTIIRIDVDSVDVGYAIPQDNPFVGDPRAADEVWAYGLRNPWRFSFDAANGDLYIADVGQNRWEEVNVQPASSSGGENYGWNRYEANQEFQREVFPPITPYVFPALAYDHSEGCSITGGDVYRGSVMPDLNGKYIFGEYCRGTIWSMTKNANGQYVKSVLISSALGISSFGTDEAGELYVVHLGLALAAPGAVYRIVPA